MKFFSKISIVLLLLIISSGLSARNIFTKTEKSIVCKANLVLTSATISGTTTVCQNAASPVITFTGSGGIAPYTFTYNINGGANIITAPSTGNTITISAPTGVVGVFIYNLISVKDSTNATQNQTGSATVTVSAPPTVDFTFTNDNTCSGTALQFTSNVIGSGTYVYSWNFGDASTLSNQQNPSHSFTSLGCGTATFNVVLTITGGGCTVTRNRTVTVKQKPDISFSDNINPFDPFSNCNNAAANPVYSIIVENTSASSCISSYSINWGDGNTQSNITFPINHTYNLIGAYSMVITANGNNGCSNSKTYIIKNVSNPLGGINSPGSTQNLCAPTANLQFSISNWGSNSLDTTYSIDYGDSSTLFLTQNQLNSSIYYNSANPSSSTNYPIPHVYTTSSCPATSFEVRLDVTNACGTTPFTLGNISILTKPVADFTSPPNGCVNTSILFTNTTLAGYGQGCVQSSIYTWNFGDGSPTITTPLSPPQNISHTYLTPGIYTVTLTAQNFCGITTKTQQICVEPPLVPLFSLNTTSGCTPLAVSATNTTNLTNQCTTPTYLWQVTHTPLYCATSTVTIPNQTTQNASFNFITPGTYNIRLTATNSCGAVTSAVQTVTVKKPPTASINAIPNFCGTAAITPSAVVDGCAPASSVLTYAWNFPGGFPSSSSAVSPGTVNYAATGNYTVSLTVANECGVSTTATEAFLVSVSPTITNTTLSQTICSGTQTTLVNITANPAGTTFSWTALATSGITGFTPSGNSNTIPVQTLTTTNTSPGTVTYTITPSIGSCVGTAVQYVITVNPEPTFTSQPLPSTACQGAALAPLSVAITSAGGSPLYQWYSNTVNNTTSGTLITGATNATYTPSSSAIGALYYYCLITLSSGGCASLTSATATVTISPLATITLQPLATQDICVGVTIPSPLTINFSGGTGTATYQWFSNTSNSIVGGTAIPGATNASYTPTVFTSPGTFYYYVVLTLSGNGCGATTSTVAAINVSADPTISSQPNASQTLCQGTIPTTLSVTAVGGLGAFSYQWYAAPATLIPSAISSTFVPDTNIVGTTNYYCIVSQPGLGCEVTSANAQVVVVPAPTISSQPQSSAICVGGVPNPLSVTYTNGTGAASYQWYDGAGLISGATAATFTPTLTATTSYYCIVTFSSGGCTNITSNTAVITVEPLPTINLQPILTQSVCVGGVIPPLTVSYLNGAGTPTYQWYSNSTNATTGGTPVGTNSASFSPPVFNTSGTFYYYTTVSLSGNGCGAATSNSSEVIVVADPILNTQPFAAQTLCQGTTPTTLAITASGGLGVISYQWYSNSPPNTLLAGATNDTYIPDTSVPGTTSYYCVVSQPGLGCEVASNLAAVNVVPAPLFTTQPQNRAVCEGGTVAPINVAYSNGTGVASYQWYSNSTNSNSGGTIIIGATINTFNPPSSNVGTVYYYCEITFSSGGCTLITSNTAEVTIFQIPVIVAQNVVTCTGDLLNFIPQPSSGNIIPTNTFYTWNLISINPLGSVTGATTETVPQSGLIQTLVSSINQVATVTYIVTPVAGICNGNSFTVEVLVYPKPVVIFDIANQTICDGSSSSLVTLSSATPGATTFTWTAIVPAGISGAILSGTDTIPVQTLVNSTAIPLTVTYAAVGTFTSNSVGCDGPASIYSITVNPTIISSGTVSNYNGYGVSFFGATDGFIDLTVTGGSETYTYVWSGSNGFSATTEDLNGIPAGTYSVIVSDGFCVPTILTFILTQPPELLFQEDLSVHVNLICFGDNNGVLGITITQESVPPYDFQVINSSGTIVNTILNDTGLHQVFTGLGADTYSVKIIDANGGVKILNGIIITQPNDIVVTAATTPITCYGANNASITLTVSGGTGPYTAQWDNLATGFFQDNLSAATYIILVTDTNNCTKSISVVIPEALLFTVNPIVKNISCFGSNDGSINLNFVGGIPAINLAWSDGSTAGTTRNNLGPGTYSVTIIDGTPCTIARTFTIVEPQPLVLSANLTNAFDCNDANSGAINLLVSGGTPPFVYSWSNGATTEDLSAITGGNYFVTVTDANGCTQTGQYVISRPAPIGIAITTQTDFDCDTRYVYQDFMAQVSGGIPPYQLQWSSGTSSGVNNEIMHSNVNGAVLLTVTDSYGCVATNVVNVATPALGYSSFDTTSTGYTTYGIYSIGDPIQFQSIFTGDYVSISWDFGDGTFSTELNPVHMYNIPKDYIIKQTVTYPFGCIYVQTISLIVEKGYVLVVPTAFTPNGDGLNDTFRPVTKALNNVQLDIYDTWGSLIYSEKGDVLKGWDAKIKGINAENGNYYSKVSAETFYGTIVNSNQTFVLIK
jgi:gliding motility-associated-like protein